jgi:hypothetical protein
MAKKDEMSKEQQGALAMDNLIRICRDGRERMTAKGELVTLPADATDFKALQAWLRERQQIRKDFGLESDSAPKVDPLVSGIRGMTKSGEEDA